MNNICSTPQHFLCIDTYSSDRPKLKYGCSLQNPEKQTYKFLSGIKINVGNIISFLQIGEGAIWSSWSYFPQKEAGYYLGTGYDINFVCAFVTNQNIVPASGNFFVVHENLYGISLHEFAEKYKKQLCDIDYQKNMLKKWIKEQVYQIN